MKTPNFENARTRKTLKNAIGMTIACLDAEKPRNLGTRFIDRYYGQQGKPTGDWLRKTLLISHSNTWSYGKRSKCKTYTYNPGGIELIKSILNYTTTIHQQTELDRTLALEWVKDTFVFDDIEYEDKSNRLWNPIQNLPKAIRSAYLSEMGLCYQYDMICAAPTLLHQMSWRHSHGHVLEYIDDYINNRTDIRNKLANETGLPVANIKILINGLFAGARFGANKHCSTYQYVNQDRTIIEFLKQHVWFTGLRNDINQMWEYLRPELPVITKTLKNGKTRKEQMTPRNKWNLYFSLERSVLNEIRSYLELEEVNKKYFLIHDAFVSESLPFGIDDLERWIYERTGFNINLEMNIIS